MEKTYLIRYLTEEKGRLNRVTERIGVNARTFTSMLQKHGIDKYRYKSKRIGVKKAGENEARPVPEKTGV